jgi:hypothetical protein
MKIVLVGYALKVSALKIQAPPEEIFDELICGACVEKHPFIKALRVSGRALHFTDYKEPDVDIITESIDDEPLAKIAKIEHPICIWIIEIVKL